MLDLPDPTSNAIKGLLSTYAEATSVAGWHLFHQDAVKTLKSKVSGKVYWCHLELDGSWDVTLYLTNNLGAYCSCWQKVRCPHIFASFLALLKETNHLEPDLLLSEDTSTRNALEARFKAVCGKEETAAHRKFLQKLRSMYARARRTLSVNGYDLMELGIPLPYTAWTQWSRLKLWKTFPEDESKFWNHIAYGLKKCKVPIPGFMEEVTDWEETSAEMAEIEREELTASWKDLLQRFPWKTEADRIRQVDLQAVIGLEGLSFRVREGDETEFHSLNAAKLRRLDHDLGRGVAQLGPESAPFRFLLGHIAQTSNAHLDLTKASNTETSFLNGCLRSPIFAGRIVNIDGKAFDRPPERIEWRLRPAESGNDHYKLQFCVPSSAVGKLLYHFPGQPPLYVFANAIYEGPPSSPGLDVYGENVIPAPALETQEGLEMLRYLGLELPPRILSRTKKLDLRPRITCELVPSRSGNASEVLHVRVVSSTAEGDEFESCTPDGWIEIEQRNQRKKEENLFLVDRTLLAGFPRLVELLGLKYDAYAGRWQMRIGKGFPEKFLSWLQGLPARVQVELKGELESFAKAPVTGKIRLDCQEAALDWFDLQVVLDVNTTELTKEELKLLMNARGRHVRLANKGWRKLEFQLPEEDMERLARLGLSPEDFSSETQRYHAMQLTDDAASAFLPQKQIEAIRARVAELKTRVTPPLPAELKAELRPYQIEGFHFLCYLSANRFGGILADDMGLGKTVQTLAWLLLLRSERSKGRKAILVVCPKSVMDNWRSEAERFCPGLKVHLWKGTDGGTLRATARQSDIVVLNYTQLRGLADVLPKVQWLAAILDEGQYIKNPQSQTAQVARQISADYRIALSGTPIENRLLDLWSLMSFAMPGLLGNRLHFTKRFGSTDDPWARQRLVARVRPFMLRRTKAQVASDLPDRIEEDIFCELEGEQKALYRAEFKHAQQMLLKVKTKTDLNEFRFHFLTSLLRLRQICCHPGLYNPDLTKAESAKVNALIDLLEPLMEEGHKVLVFSQFVSMLEVLKKELSARSWPYFYLAGETENRGELVSAFGKASGAAVFLISLKAGGFGLNLTAASYVVMFDPWWNPAVEAQAIDRTHRIGQRNKVIAYRLLAKETIEEKIRALQRQKSALAADILGEQNFAQSLTLEDLQYLFNED